MKWLPAVLSSAALLCFAGNSIVCRFALADRRIDAVSFTSIRLASGAVVLVALAGRRLSAPTRSAWVSALALFAYAAPFSFAYLRLGAAMGALILFGSVQVTMLGWGVRSGERPGGRFWLGTAVAVLGLVGLTFPGLGTPDPPGMALMCVAGVAWGAYSLRGRAAGAGDPLPTTALSFLLSVPFVLLLLSVAAARGVLAYSGSGILLAIASGALTSGLGYSIWYAALRYLTATRAAVLQLSVPILASAGAVALLGEALSLRLLIASAAILGGVGITIRQTPAPSQRAG